MLTQADTDRAIAVVCPLGWCAASIGEWCVSRTHPGLTVPPHMHRLIRAGVMAPPAAPRPTQEA